MPALIKSILICPRCDSGITAATQAATCPECGLVLGTKTAGPIYQPPLTLSEQHVKYGDSELNIKTFVGLSAEKATDMMNDALNIMQTLTAKNVPVSDIRTLMGYAHQIGELAKSFEAYLQAGGKIVPSLLLQLEKDRNELPSSAQPSELKQPNQENQYEYQEARTRVQIATGTENDAGIRIPEVQ